MLNEEFLENIVSNDEEKILAALNSISMCNNITYEEGELLFEILKPYLLSENLEIKICAGKACSFLKSKFNFNTVEPELLPKEIQTDHINQVVAQNTHKSWSKILLFFFFFLLAIGFAFFYLTPKTGRREFVSKNLIQRINSLYAAQIRLNLDRRLRQAHFIATDYNLFSEGLFSWSVLSWFCAKETKLKKAFYRNYIYRNPDGDYTEVPKNNNEEITLTYNAQGFPKTESRYLTSRKIISRFPRIAAMKSEFMYDNKNNIISKYKSHPLVNDTCLIAKYSYSCVNGIRIVEINHNDVYKFDSHGNILEVIIRKTSGLIRRKILFEYKLGKLAKKINIFTPESYSESYSKKTFYNYDSSGLLIEEVSYRENQLVKQSSYVYDEKKQLISITQKTRDRLYKYQYNSQGLLTHKTMFLKHPNDPTNTWFPEYTYKLESTEYFE
jgi:hypothetical protein